MKGVFLFFLFFCLTSCSKILQKDCPADESCQVCNLCIQNNLTKDVYWDEDIQGAHDDTIFAGKIKCIKVDAMVKLAYDKRCQRTQYNYAGRNMMVGTQSLYMKLDRCEKNFTIQYKINKDVEIIDENPVED